MEPIATRVLIYRDEEREADVLIRLFAPEPQDNHWICRFEIVGPDETLKRYGAGQDSMQALVLALTMIGAILYASDAHKKGKWGWERVGSGYGFPVMNTMRDLLVGDDAKYF
jgi:hypothetical protein